MKNVTYPLIWIISAVLLLGCSTLSKNECLQANWYELGWRDGSLGKRRSIFQGHVDACVKHNVHAEKIDYFRGRDDGLKNFCTYDNGFSQGRYGKKYNYVCPSNLEATFLAGFRKGRKVYHHNRKVAALEKRLKKIDEEIKGKEKLLYSSEVTGEQRAILRSEIRQLDVEYRDIARDLNELRKIDTRS
jgi:hypothetical protein